MKNLRKLLFLGLLCFSTQAQMPGWQTGGPTPFLQGPTLGATLRNASRAVNDQLRIVRRSASDVGRKAHNPNYGTQGFYADYEGLKFQFQGLRSTFGLMSNLALQAQQPRTSNAVAELDAGLGIIAEAFNPVEQELQAGMVNRDTVVTMCRILEDALNVWEREFKKNSSRLNLIW
jgi:hypothetical protein